jgi:hypothetical protein
MPTATAHNMPATQSAILEQASQALPLAAMARPGEERRDAGRHHFTEALGAVLRTVSHPELAALADWACDEPGNLHTSQISHLRNAKMRMLGVKSLDALGRINQAAWAFQVDRSGLFRRAGTASTSARAEEILSRYVPLLHPSTGLPLGAGDLMALYLGYLTLPGVAAPRELGEADAAALAPLIGPFVEGVIESAGLRFRDAVAQIRRDWPGEKAGADRLAGAASGMTDYAPDDLQADWDAIVAALGRLMGEDLDGASLAEMVAATASGRLAEQ